MSAAEKLGWRRSFPPGVRRPPTSPAALPPASPGGGRRKVALLAQGYRIHRACRWIRISAWRAAALQTSEGWCGREARRGQLRGAGRRVSCIPVAQSFALPCRSRSWFRCPASGRFGPSAQVPTGHALPFAPAGVWGRAPKPYAAAFFVSVASVRRREGKRVPCGHLPPEVAKRPGAHRREASAQWAVARSAKRPAGAPEGSVCPVGTWAEGPKRPGGVSKYKGCARSARRTPIFASEQIQGLRAASAQNADICERQGSAND